MDLTSNIINIGDNNVSIDNNGNILVLSDDNVSYTLSSGDGTTLTLGGTVGNLNSISWSESTYTPYFNIEHIKNQYSVDELLDAYSIEEFENAIRKRKINRIMKNE